MDDDGNKGVGKSTEFAILYCKNTHMEVSYVCRLNLSAWCYNGILTRCFRLIGHGINRNLKGTLETEGRLMRLAL